MLPENFSIKDFQKSGYSVFLKELILQLQKDALMSGLDFDISENSTGKQLILYLNDFLEVLIQKDYTSFANFLYRIDVSEKELTKLNETDLEKLTGKISELILKKEWRKIWFRSKNL